RRTGVRGPGRRSGSDAAGCRQSDGRGAGARGQAACAAESRRACGAELGGGALGWTFGARGEKVRMRGKVSGSGERQSPHPVPSPRARGGGATKSVADRYNALVSEHGFEFDPAQAELAGRLDALAVKLNGYKAEGKPNGL